MNILFNIDEFKEMRENKNAIYQSLMDEGIRIYEIIAPIEYFISVDEGIRFYEIITPIESVKKRTNVPTLTFICQEQIFFYKNELQSQLLYLPNIYKNTVNAFINFKKCNGK